MLTFTCSYNVLVQAVAEVSRTMSGMLSEESINICSKKFCPRIEKVNRSTSLNTGIRPDFGVSVIDFLELPSFKWKCVRTNSLPEAMSDVRLFGKQMVFLGLRSTR